MCLTSSLKVATVGMGGGGVWLGCVNLIFCVGDSDVKQSVHTPHLAACSRLLMLLQNRVIVGGI